MFLEEEGWLVGLGFLWFCFGVCVCVFGGVFGFFCLFSLRQNNSA